MQQQRDPSAAEHGGQCRGSGSRKARASRRRRGRVTRMHDFETGAAGMISLIVAHRDGYRGVIALFGY